MDVTKTVTIPVRDYAELIGKAFAYDAFQSHLREQKTDGIYITNLEKALFLNDSIKEEALRVVSEPDEEEDEIFFSDEEWSKIEEMAEEEKE